MGNRAYIAGPCNTVSLGGAMCRQLSPTTGDERSRNRPLRRTLYSRMIKSVRRIESQIEMRDVLAHVALPPLLDQVGILPNIFPGHIAM